MDTQNNTNQEASPQAEILLSAPAERKGPSRDEVLRHTAKALRQLGRIFHAEDLEAAFPEVFATRSHPQRED